MTIYTWVDQPEKYQYRSSRFDNWFRQLPGSSMQQFAIECTFAVDPVIMPDTTSEQLPEFLELLSQPEFMVSNEDYFAIRKIVSGHITPEDIKYLKEYRTEIKPAWNLVAHHHA